MPIYTRTDSQLIIGGYYPRLIFNFNDCIECGICVAECPANAIVEVQSGVDVGNGTVWGNTFMRIYTDRCSICGDCADGCPTSALIFEETAPPSDDNGGGDRKDETVDVNIEGEKVDPKKEVKCFSTTQGAKLTVYVQQPNPGSRDLLGVNQVGHTFIGIEQGGLTRYLGFYPNDPQASVLKPQPSEVHDNSGTKYNVSISLNIDAAHLANVIGYINNTPAQYDLNRYNCTDWALQIAAKGGLDLPQSIGTFNAGAIKFSGHNPGDLGEDIKNMATPSGATKSSTETNAPTKKGGC